jgi:hypothetical protein
VNLQRIASIQMGKIIDSKMLRNTPISPVIKTDAESDARFFFRQYSFYSAVCSIEIKKNTWEGKQKKPENL